MTAPACPLTAAELRVMANWRKGVARDSSAALAKLNEARRPTGKAITDILALWLADALEAKEKAEAERDALKAELQNIASANWRKWESEVRSPESFVAWAQNRARYAIGDTSLRLDKAVRS